VSIHFHAWMEVCAEPKICTTNTWQSKQTSKHKDLINNNINDNNIAAYNVFLPPRGTFGPPHCQRAGMREGEVFYKVYYFISSR